MDALDVELLHAVGPAARRGHDGHVGKLGDGRLVAPRERNDLDALPAGDLGRLDDVAARAGRRDGKKHVALAAVRLDITREDLLVAVVVADAGHVRGVGNRKRCVGTTVAAVAARHLLRKMHGVAETAAVAAAHHLAVALDGVRHEACRRHDGFNRLLVGDQGVERIACVVECGQNVCFFHVGPL